jgi:hypothetical protein
VLKTSLRRPLRWIVAYLWATFLLSLTGLVVYSDYDWPSVAVFLSLATVALVLGFYGVSSIVPGSSGAADTAEAGGGTFWAQLVAVSLVLALVLELTLFASYVAQYSVPGLSGMLARLLTIGDVYRSAIAASRADSDVDLLRQVITLLGLTKQIAIVGFVWYRKRLQRWAPVFYGFILIYAANVLIFKGTQKDIGDLVIYVVGAILLSRSLKGSGLGKKIGKPLLLGSAALGLFGFMQVSRAATYGVSMTSFGNRFFSFNAQSLFYKLFGPQAGFAVAILTHYVSGGYYGLAKSLSMPFVWTRGLGSSFALSSYAQQYFGTQDMLQYAYPVRAELATGYSATMYWSTAFPWLASDLTFFGSIVAVLLIARVYAIAWRESVGFGNFLSVLLITRLNIFWLYLPANNQLMQTRESVIATVLLAVIWLAFHTRFNVLGSRPVPVERSEAGDA